jgi:glutamate/tyrosine decarboxylase-like PLP-dependent enzyme
MKHLNWFLGPKGENSDFLVESVLAILQDYIHWRRNYFPSDTILIDKKTQRENQNEYDKIHKGLMELIAKLRGNFPFYSPRYMGHMLSDISIPATLGYVAGMLHNSNNCTTEAAPVTVEWEIEACNNILEMLGFTPSPRPPSKDAKTDDELEKYKSKLKKEFGWAHITSGGTVANIEALWVARIIKYYPLAIQDVAKKERLKIEIKLPKHTESTEEKKDIKDVSQKELLFIKPNESIYLFSSFIDALRKSKGISVAEANKLSSKLLKESKYSLSNNMGRILTKFPPVIFASGTAHYSIKKAADLLGIGSNNAVLVNMDSNFRLDIKDLKRKIDIAINEDKIPLAVIAIAGTTEEGAVDPIHEIVTLREEYEKDNKSFWLHIDSAWGGYISSLFKLDEEEEINMILDKIYHKLSEVESNSNTKEKIKLIISKLSEKILLLKSNREKERNEKLENYRKELEKLRGNLNVSLIDLINNLKVIVIKYADITSLLKKEDFSLNKDGSLSSDLTEKQINELLDKISNKISGKKLEVNINEKFYSIVREISSKSVVCEDHIIESFRRKLQDIENKINNNNITPKQFINSLRDISLKLDNSITDSINLKKNDFILNLEDRGDFVADFVSDRVNFSLSNNIREKIIRWGGKSTVSSFLSFKYADSITIDPHKLGYVPYPCGVIAFRNDRVRHFIMQRAPYITSSKHNALRHNPPQHIKNIDDIDDIGDKDYNVGIDAFAPFILEGSKPGAAASALWFSSKMIPLNRKNHGLIIKESIIAARELYEWISTWENIYKDKNKSEELAYQFKTFGLIPDTNVFVFALKSKLNNTIKGMNVLTNEVYQKFSISVEQGSKKHSYSQSFFLSKTEMDEEHYKFEVFKEWFKKDCGIDMKNAESEYKNNGLTVLRATIMSPYIAAIRRNTNQNLIKDLVWELHKCAKECAIKKDII